MGIGIVPMFNEIIPVLKENNVKTMCMIGKQDIDFTCNDFVRYANKFQVEYDESMLDDIKKQKKIDSHTFFRMLDVDEVHSLDYSDYEGADIIVNLNYDEIPHKFIGYFDLVLNGGTLEHVFDVRKAISSIDSLAKVGG